MQPHPDRMARPAESNAGALTKMAHPFFLDWEPTIPWLPICILCYVRLLFICIFFLFILIMSLFSFYSKQFNTCVIISTIPTLQLNILFKSNENNMLENICLFYFCHFHTMRWPCVMVIREWYHIFLTYNFHFQFLAKYHLKLV